MSALPKRAYDPEPIRLVADPGFDDGDGGGDGPAMSFCWPCLVIMIGLLGIMAIMGCVAYECLLG